MMINIHYYNMQMIIQYNIYIVLIDHVSPYWDLGSKIQPVIIFTSIPPYLPYGNLISSPVCVS